MDGEGREMCLRCCYMAEWYGVEGHGVCLKHMQEDGPGLVR
jgi:hypothetical protein